MIPAYVGWVASIFLAFGTVLNTVAGVDLVTAIWVGAGPLGGPAHSSIIMVCSVEK